MLIFTRMFQEVVVPLSLVVLLPRKSIHNRQ